MGGFVNYYRLVLITLLWLFFLSGCVSIGTLADKELNNKVFSGTIGHIDMACAHGNCIDAPFSLVVDVVMLPITIPWSIYNVSTNQAEKYRKSQEKAETYPEYLKRKSSEPNTPNKQINKD